jgi:hypothetical protein
LFDVKHVFDMLCASDFVWVDRCDDALSVFSVFGALTGALCAPDVDCCVRVLVHWRTLCFGC